MKIAKIIFYIVLSTSAIAQGQTKRNLTIDDFLAIKDVRDPQISPDGKWVAYVAESKDLKKDASNDDIYMVPFEGGETLQLTAFAGDDNYPRWSPDDKYLAFLSKRNKKKQIFLLNRNGGDAVQLTDVKQGVSDFSWSPDSKKLAIVITDPGPEEDSEEKEEDSTKPIVVTRLQFKYDEYGYLTDQKDHIYIFDIRSKSLKQITSGPYNDAGEVWSTYTSTPQWSPDGKQILFVSDRTGDADSKRNTDLFLISAEGGEPKRLTDNPGADEAPQWSPDGKYIVYQQNLQPDLIYYDTTELAIIPATGGTPKPLTRELDRNAYGAHFSPDSKLVYFLLEDHGNVMLCTVAVGGGSIDKDVADEKILDDFDIAPNGAIVFTAANPDLPNEVFALHGNKSKQITFMNAKVFDKVQLGGMDRIHFKSKDGTEVEGFVTRPPQFDPSKKYPLILSIHGGPTMQFTEDFRYHPQYWEANSQLFAANGYVFLQVNPRGSYGYGEEFCKAIWADWGNKDYDDVMAGVDYVISQGYVDVNRMGVIGWSYGGILTDVVITKTNRFKAAAAGAGMINHFLGYGIDQYQFEWEKEIGLPWEKPEAFLKLSPFFRIKNVTTPTLIMDGQDDQNVPLINSEQLYEALKRRGVDTMLIVYPEEPHVIYRPSFQKDIYQRFFAWFGHYLQGASNKVP